jgi:hypothetical protein
MSWIKPNDLEKIIKNCTNSVIDDLDYFDYDINQQYKKELFTFFKKIFVKYGLFKSEHITTLEL